MSDRGFDNKAYWQKRMMDRLISVFDDTDRMMVSFRQNIAHAKLESEEMIKAMEKIMDGFNELSRAIANAKNKPKAKLPKQKAAAVKAAIK